MDMISREERQEKITQAGLHVACYGEKQTHAICRHGVITKIHTDGHSCRWLALAKNEESVDEVDTDKL